MKLNPNADRPKLRYRNPMSNLKRQLSINLNHHSYPITIGAGLLSQSSTFDAWLTGRPVALISNRVVAPLVLPILKQTLGSRLPDCLILDDGEATKNAATLSMVYDHLAAQRIARDGLIIALGGGVIGDLAGFAAATWQRGIDVLQIPTTLLSQVDSSVGGKTAVNHSAGKNLIGAFHQPVGVIADVTILKTLPSREFSAGLAEIIKYGLIEPDDFWHWLNENIERLMAQDEGALIEAVERSCAIKARIVSMDEREQGVRATLNFGHTFGHAIETGTHYKKWLHGEAVALGMILATKFSEQMGLLKPGLSDQLVHLCGRAKLPTEVPRLGAQAMLSWMGLDKKVMSSKIRLVLLKERGRAYVTSEFSDERLQQFLHEQCEVQ